MAGNFGKFTDRSPIICSAGKSFGDPEDTLASLLKRYPLQDQVDCLKHEAGIFEEHSPAFKYKFPRLHNSRHCGSYTPIRPSMQPPLKTRYQTLINDLKDTSFSSFWNKQEGSVRDPYAGLPPGMDVKGTTFGAPTITLCTMKDLINPDKSVIEVLHESQIGHEMYKKTHNDYNTGERRVRGYAEPPFNPRERLGGKVGYDLRGIWAPCVLNWYKPDTITTENETRADFQKRSQHKLGKCLSPLNNIESVPKGHRFGKPCKRELYGMEELLKDPDRPPCVFKRDYLDWMKHLNEMRIRLKNRSNKFDFCLKDFHDAIKYYDQDHSGWLPLDLFYELCKCYKVNFEHELLEPLLSIAGALTSDGLVNHEIFIKLVDINTSLPELIKINDIPLKNQYFKSSYRSANCEFLEMDNSGMPPAGTPGIRFDRIYLEKPEGGIRADIGNLGNDITSAELVNPSVYTNYGLSFRDFFMPRQPKIIRTMFENIGYKLSDDVFEKLWKIGLEHDKTGLVCVDTFNKLIQESLPPPTFIAKELNIKC